MKLFLKIMYNPSQALAFSLTIVQNFGTSGRPYFTIFLSKDSRLDVVTEQKPVDREAMRKRHTSANNKERLHTIRR
jgi:hypothetical protein